MDKPALANSVYSIKVSKVLRALFLKLLIRGRFSRGAASRSHRKLLVSKLGVTLFFAALWGVSAGLFIVEGETLYSFSTYLHASTLASLGVFSFDAGSSYFLAMDDAEILLHRPISPRELLLAKFVVFVQVSLWVAAAVNLTGLYVGVSRLGGNWGFLAAHILSSILAVLFFDGVLLLLCQLNLLWFRRARGDLVGVAVLFSIVIFIGIHLFIATGPLKSALGNLIGNASSWFAEVAAWKYGFLPALWFAGIDDALAGTGSRDAWILSGIGVATTLILLWVTLWKFAAGFHRNLQEWAEAELVVRASNKARRWMQFFIDIPPLRWLLRNSEERASFMLVAQYLLRDSTLRLKVFTSILITLLPLLLVSFQPKELHDLHVYIALIGIITAMLVPRVLNDVRFTNQWQASFVFQVAPLVGPVSLMKGARMAAYFLVALPTLLLCFCIIFFTTNDFSTFAVALPGILLIPVNASVFGMSGYGLPLSLPPESSREFRYLAINYLILVITGTVVGLGILASMFGLLTWFILAEAIWVLVALAVLRERLPLVRWPQDNPH